MTLHESISNDPNAFLGDILASGGDDGVIRMWNKAVDTGEWVEFASVDPEEDEE
jgi:hypothetical protein